MTTPSQIIWTQITIGTKMACGARRPMCVNDNTLTFDVLSGAKNAIVVTLDPSDTYTVQRTKRKKYNVTVEEEMSDVYVDNLNEVIYRMCNK